MLLSTGFQHGGARRAFSTAFSTHPQLLVKLGAPRCNLLATRLRCRRGTELAAVPVELGPDLGTSTMHGSHFFALDTRQEDAGELFHRTKSARDGKGRTFSTTTSSRAQRPRRELRSRCGKFGEEAVCWALRDKDRMR